MNRIHLIAILALAMTLSGISKAASIKRSMGLVIAGSAVKDRELCGGIAISRNVILVPKSCIIFRSGSLKLPITFHPRHSERQSRGPGHLVSNAIRASSNMAHTTGFDSNRMYLNFTLIELENAFLEFYNLLERRPIATKLDLGLSPLVHYTGYIDRKFFTLKTINYFNSRFSVLPKGHRFQIAVSDDKNPNPRTHLIYNFDVLQAKDVAARESRGLSHRGAIYYTEDGKMLAMRMGPKPTDIAFMSATVINRLTAAYQELARKSRSGLPPLNAPLL